MILFLSLQAEVAVQFIMWLILICKNECTYFLESIHFAALQQLNHLLILQPKISPEKASQKMLF